jgi:hypothetical protein
VFAGNMVPGAPMDDAPVAAAGGEPWLLQVLGDRFQVLHYVVDAADLDAASVAALQSLGEGRHRGRADRGRPRGQAPAGLRTVIDSEGPYPRALRPAARHHLPRPPRPARRRALARPRPGPRARRRRPRHLQRLKETAMALNTQPNLFEPGKRYFRAFSPGDDFYEALIETHRELSDEQSEMVNARLILLLANHIGDIAVLREAMKLAREGVAGEG